MTTATSIDGFLAAVCGSHGGALWSADATLDAVVPGWRFVLNGADAIDEKFRTWFRDPGTLEEVRQFSTPSGEIVEFTVTWVEDGVPHAARQVHVLDIDDSGRISRDNMWCGGRWSADLLARMGATRDAG